MRKNDFFAPQFGKRITHKFFLFLAVVLILFSLFYLLPSSYLAQNNIAKQGLEISPPSQELVVNPGETIQINVSVRNVSDREIPIDARVEDFSAVGDQGQIALIDEGPWSVTQWTDISPSQFTLAPNATQEVIVTIQIPTNGAAGGRYGSVVFSIQGEKKGNAATLAQEIASLFLLRISGPVNENMSIIKMSAPSFLEFGPVPLDITFKNEGNIHVKAAGIINVMNIFGQKVDDVVIPPTNVFPDAERVVTAQLDKKWLLGPYQALAIVYYGEGNDRITAFTPFFVFPVRIVAAILIVIALMYFFRKRILKAINALFNETPPPSTQ